MHISLVLIEISELYWPISCCIPYIMKNDSYIEKKGLSLTQAVLDSSYYGDKRVTLARDILKLVLKRYPNKHKNEDFADFIADMYEKIPGIATKYEFYGIPFEHYVMRLVYMNFKRYSRTKKQTTTYKNACIWSEYITRNGGGYEGECGAQNKMSNVDVHDDIVELMLHVLGVYQRPLRKAEKKWLLILAVKCGILA